MSDTQRTRAQLLTYLADNVTGAITPQVMRDMLVTLMEPEFFGPGDAFAGPNGANTPTDQTMRGWKRHSQIMNSACSLGNVVVMDSDGGWRLAQPGNSGATGIFGLACGTYASGATNADILVNGIVNMSAFSATFSGYVGKPLYLAANGSITVSAFRSIGSAASVTNSGAVLIGWVEGSDTGSKAIGKFRFCPTWAVTETIT